MFWPFAISSKSTNYYKIKTDMNYVLYLSILTLKKTVHRFDL